MITGAMQQNKFGVWRGYIRGYNIELHDMSKAGGEFVDWMVIIHDRVIFIEVKPERDVKDASRQKLTDDEYYHGELTEGEKSFIINTYASVRICATHQHIVDYVTETVNAVEFEDTE